MFNTLHTDVFRWLRESAGVSQRELADAAGLPLRRVQRIESGDKPPCGAEESAIYKALACSHPFFVELVCKSLTRTLGQPVTIAATGGYRPATPIAELNEQLQAARERIPDEQWWSWVERLVRLRAFDSLVEQEALAMRRELRALRWKLGSEGEPEDEPAREAAE